MLAPESYARRKELMFEGIETVRRLWRGEAVELRGGGGSEISLKIRPRPVQPELPVWVTAAGNPETFRRRARSAPACSPTCWASRSTSWRRRSPSTAQSWKPRPGGAPEGHVTLMLHTFVHPDLEYVRDRVRSPFIRYLESSLGLVKNLAASLGRDMDSGSFTEDDKAAILEYAFERYFETSSLFGTPETCLAMVGRLKEIGVDEVACLIDFGVDVEATLSALEHLDGVRERINAIPAWRERRRMPCRP